MQQRFATIVRFVAMLGLLAMVACGGGEEPAAEPSTAEPDEPSAAASQPATDAAPAQAGGAEPTAAADEQGDTGFEDVMAAVEGLDGQERIDELVALAQDEGPVQIYSTMNS
ncbi:MAG TPA: hypothetical protein VHK28_06595, partial [Candidatus Limnocylindria bacterium]|nr:hypothetical protein [Candidatus Limnocylindria bacterium]